MDNNMHFKQRSHSCARMIWLNLLRLGPISSISAVGLVAYVAGVSVWIVLLTESSMEGDRLSHIEGLGQG